MKDNKLKKIVLLGLMTALSLGIYALESMLSPIVPIPGIKLGAANIINLICIYVFGAKDAFAVLMLRIFMSALLFAQPLSLLFAISGGILSFAVMLILSKFLSQDSIWAISIFGAFAHNLGQIISAIAVTGDFAVAYYFLFLIISSVITGLFTGVCAQYFIKKSNKIKVLK